MSGESDNDEEKTLEPSQRRLDDLRQKGDIPRSGDLIGAAALIGFALVFLAAGPRLLNDMMILGMWLLGQPDRLVAPTLEGMGGYGSAVLSSLVTPFLLIFGLPLLLALAAALAQRSLHFVPSRLAPQWSRISPLQGLKGRLGLEGLVAFLRSLLKSATVLVAFVFVLGPELPVFLNRHDLSGGAVGVVMSELSLHLLIVSAVLFLAFGGLDYLWQWFQHRQRARMSREEMKEEMKDSEGDPHVKAQRRQRAQEIALNKMLADVRTADVIVVNPTHYAVALKWKRSDARPPVVVAKGVDEIAARIRERAAIAGVPIYSDPPTARALHATVEIGKTIRPDHYKAVAAAIRFSELIRRRAKGMTHGA